jgi:hypothetical protein
MLCSGFEKRMLCRHFRVFKKESKSIKVFPCLEDLSTQLYAVQSCDLSPAARAAFQEEQLFERFAEEFPLPRCQWFATIADAIAAREQSFE